MAKEKEYIALDKGQTPDGTWHLPGERFSTDAPVGAWMGELDEKGQVIPKPPISIPAMPVEAARAETAEKALKLAMEEIERIKAEIAKPVK